eukprot:gene5510-8386_t
MADMDSVDDGFVLLPSPACCTEPGLPEPSAPPLAWDVHQAPLPAQFPDVPTAAPQYAGPAYLTPEVLQIARAAVAADTRGQTLEAIKTYNAAIVALVHVEKSRHNAAEKDVVNAMLHRYGERVEVLRRNAKHIAARDEARRADLEKLEKLEKRANPPPPAAATAPVRPCGWDGTLFSGQRRGLFETGQRACEQGRLFEAKGQFLPAKEAYQVAAEALLGFLKDERDVKVASVVGEKVRELLSKAEELAGR